MALDPVTDKFFELQRVYTPDSRLTRTERTEFGPLGEMEPVFCANCGVRQGSVTKDFFELFMILCDDCYAKHGALPLPEIPEPLMAGVVVP